MELNTSYHLDDEYYLFDKSIKTMYKFSVILIIIMNNNLPFILKALFDKYKNIFIKKLNYYNFVENK